MIRNSITLVIGLLFSISVSAITKQEYCSGYAQTATFIMQERQRGSNTIEDTFAILNEIRAESSKGDEFWSDIFNIIIEAYEQPRYMTKDYQDRAITEFGNEYFVYCYKNTKGS